jgi:hypothetical protein
MFKGSYKQKSMDGTVITYKKGDTVLFHGKLYEAVNNTSYSPIQQKSDWFYKGITEIYSNDNPPLNPKEGQIWIQNEKEYTYYYDGSNYSWVQF